MLSSTFSFYVYLFMITAMKKQKKTIFFTIYRTCFCLFHLPRSCQFHSILWRSQRSNNLIFLNFRYSHLCLCEVLKSCEPTFTNTKYLHYSISEKLMSVFHLWTFLLSAFIKIACFVFGNHLKNNIRSIWFIEMKSGPNSKVIL